jgi:hypothetical protein
MSNVNFAISKPCLIHLTMKVRTATCAAARAAKVAALASGAGRMRIASGACSRLCNVVVQHLTADDADLTDKR